MTYRYRLESPSTAAGTSADIWSLQADAASARRAASRMLTRRCQPVPWVRVILLDASGDAGDGFVTAADISGWTAELTLPPPSGATPVAAPEIDRLRERALAGIDVVLSWALRRRLLTQIAADEIRLVFDAALLGVAWHRDL